MADLSGYYINETDLKPYIDGDELIRLTQEIVADPPETNIQRAIKNVCALADTYLEAKYDLPLVDTINTAPLKAALAKIVVWDITGLYGSVSDEVMKKREKDYDEAMKFLEALAEGKSKLINNDPLLAETEVDKYYFDANLRIGRDFY